MKRLRVFSEPEIRRNSPTHFLKICVRQYLAERSYKKKGTHFRSTSPEQIAKAYQEMDEESFDAINGRQQWANWRVIPRSLSGNISNQKMVVIDLGCGTGTSTDVLAYYLPRGSKIIGIELNPSFVEIARSRQFCHADGTKIQAEFVEQSVTTPFHSMAGLIPKGSIDYVNSSGVIGHHLDLPQFQQLAQELARVLRAGGIAALDIGPTLSIKKMKTVMQDVGFHFQKRVRCVKFYPVGQLLFRKK